jgi:hypothetical protein
LKKVSRYDIDITWEWYEKKAAKLKRVSELERITESFTKLQNINSDTKETGGFKALDFLNLLLLEVGLLFSDEDVINDTELYEMWILLADAIYLFSLDDQTSEDIDKGARNIELFAERYVAKFTAASCTWKYHMLQHIAQQVRLHGPAFLHDGFSPERQLGWLKKDRTATRNMLSQIVRNFQLRFHSTKDAPNIGSSCRAFHSSLSLTQDDANLCKLNITPLATAPAAELSAEMLATLRDDITCDDADFVAELERQGICRATRLRWYADGFIFEK